jgi:integrase
MKPLDWANEFMLKRASALITAGKDWRQSQKAEADDLAILAIFLAARNLSFEAVKHNDLVDLAYILLNSVSPQTEKKYAVKTVRRRLNTIVRVYEHAFVECIVPETVIKYVREPTKQLIGSARARAVPVIIANLPDEPAADTHVAPIAKTNLNRILDYLGPAKPGAGTRRDRMISELALGTGLREDEIANLRLIQILMLPDPADLAENGLIKLELTHTKGSKKNSVLLPVYILKNLLEYINGERAEVIAAARALATSRQDKFREPVFLFLNGLGSNHRDIGRGCTKANIGRIFNQAVLALGLFRKEQRFVLDDDGNPELDAQTGEYRETVALVAAHSFHDLRHTYAVSVYHALRADGHGDPIRALKAMLRHALSETTRNIYLRWLDTNEPELSDRLTQALRGLTAWYA